MDIKERKNILVTCGPGLKDYLQAELEGLGFEIVCTCQAEVGPPRIRIYPFKTQTFTTK